MCADERGPFPAGDDLVAHRVWPVEARQIYAPALGLVLDDQAHISLHASSRRCYIWQAHHCVSEPVATISLVGNISLCHNH